LLYLKSEEFDTKRAYTACGILRAKLSQWSKLYSGNLIASGIAQIGK